MPAEQPQYKPGPCPFLGTEGVCESAGECPYGCTAGYRAAEAAFEAAECERMKIDKVYALSRLLITMGWVREFQGMNVPFMVDVSEKRVAVVRRYATPWVLAEFDKRWPQYWTAFSKASNKMLFFRAAEAELYSLYHADRLKGPSN